MSGDDTNIDTDLILRLLTDNTTMYVQSLLTYFGESKRNTLYRRLRELKKDGKIGSEIIHGKARYFLVQNRGKLAKVEKEPSEVDGLLLVECKKIISEIISSGLLQPSGGEIEESVEEHTKDLPQEVKDKVWQHWILTAEVMEDNRQRRQARILLLRRCETLHESLRWLQYRRKFVIPDWYGTNITNGIEAIQAIWGNPQKIGNSLGLHLLTWLEYYLEAVDVLSRKPMPEIKKRPGRPKK